MVGDAPGLFIAATVMMAIAIALRPHSAVAVIVLPLLAIMSLTVSVYRGARAATGKGVAPSPQLHTVTGMPETDDGDST
jgi:hypothetical protein